MSINSESKRFSMMDFGMETTSPGLTMPSGSISQEERQSFLWGYSGILWAEPETPTNINTISTYGVLCRDIYPNDIITRNIDTYGSIMNNKETKGAIKDNITTLGDLT